ncbi:putative effector protein, partial [Blumeria hordei DH14]
PNQEFSFSCPNSRVSKKIHLIQVVQTARQLMDQNDTDNGYPSTFNQLSYDITGALWHHPLEGGLGGQDFVIFNTDNVIVGVATRNVFNDRVVFRSCQIT